MIAADKCDTCRMKYWYTTSPPVPMSVFKHSIFSLALTLPKIILICHKGENILRYVTHSRSRQFIHATMPHNLVYAYSYTDICTMYAAFWFPSLIHARRQTVMDEVNNASDASRSVELYRKPHTRRTSK